MLLKKIQRPETWTSEDSWQQRDPHRALAGDRPARAGPGRGESPVRRHFGASAPPLRPRPARDAAPGAATASNALGLVATPPPPPTVLGPRRSEAQRGVRRDIRRNGGACAPGRGLRWARGLSGVTGRGSRAGPARRVTGRGSRAGPARRVTGRWPERVLTGSVRVLSFSRNWTTQYAS